MLMEEPGYQGTFSFGTPGGNDLDLRLCFESFDNISQEEIREKLLGRLHSEGVDVEVDLLFMTGQEFADGIRDLVELGDVEQRLKNGFDPHEQQAAVGDTSMFSLYIFSTMRMLHRNANAGQFGSPESALDNLVLTRDGAIGWMHFYTGCFLHEYLQHRQDPMALVKYQERLAKFSSRVIGGSTLAQLGLPQLANVQPQLVTAIKAADQTHSTDANMSQVLINNPDTVVLLDAESQDLLGAAGEIRSGNTEGLHPDFVMATEARLFYEAFQQGIDRRPDIGEEVDPLTAYALGELVRDLGRPITYSLGAELMAQGEPGTEIIYIPLKTAAGHDNNSVDIAVRGADDGLVATYVRTPGRVVGEGAIFGLPRSATVTATEPVEAYVIEAGVIREMLTSPDLYQQLQQPLLETRDARRLDVLLRYFAREAGIFTRQTLPYTSLADREVAEQTLGQNPLAQYNLRQRFHDTLRSIGESMEPQDGRPNPVTTIAASDAQTRTLFETGQVNDRLYVVSEGTVRIPLQNGEVVTLQPGEFFGESSILGLPTTGKAELPAGSQVLSVDAKWFKRYTQSRQPIQAGEDAGDVLPVHLLYHLAAEGYDRVRRRLTNHQGRS